MGFHIFQPAMAITDKNELSRWFQVTRKFLLNMAPVQRQLTITLVRHGETFMNVQRVMQGHSDTPLSDIGIEQARKLGRHLSNSVKFTKAYASDLQRAHVTASLILEESNNTVDLIKDTNLRERCFGDAEGKPFSEYAERAKQANLAIRNFVPEGGETTESVTRRAVQFLDMLCKLLEESSNDENVLVVTHGGWIHTFMAHLNENDNKRYKLKNFSPTQAIRVPHNTAMTVLRISPISDQSSGIDCDIEFHQIHSIEHLN